MSESLLGLQLDEYKLESKLGEGGMASVYRALDVRLNRYVAVKVIRASFRAESDYTMRFEREAQAIAQLEHPNIVTIYRYGELDNILYMAMQYVDGSDLADVIESYNEDNVFIDYDEVVRLAHEIGTALDYAHGKGVIHRDVKPHNILIAQDGRAIVSDFGLALLTEVGTRGEIFGSPHYIAPEQAISSAGVVPQSDLYSLGVMLYEMLTSTVPFLGGEPLDVAMKHMSDEPPAPRSLRPELSQDVENVLLKALAKDPNDRYPTGKALATALEDAFNAKPPTQPKRPSKFSIPERVELERQANPLPPLPAQMMNKSSSPEPETELPPPPVTPPPPLDATPRPPIQATATSTSETVVAASSAAGDSNGGLPIIPVAIGAIVLIVIIGGLLFMLSQNSSDTTADPTATEALVAEVATEADITNTDVPTDVPATNTTVPTDIPTDVPAVATQGWTLDIRWNGDDSLFIMNADISTSAFPLAPLVISGNGGNVNGTQWPVTQLEPGQCVAVFKDTGNPADANESCDLVGGRAVRQPAGARFWNNGSFAVSYNNNATRVNCRESPCIVVIP